MGYSVIVPREAFYLQILQTLIDQHDHLWGRHHFRPHGTHEGLRQALGSLPGDPQGHDVGSGAALPPTTKDLILTNLGHTLTVMGAFKYRRPPRGWVLSMPSRPLARHYY